MAVKARELRYEVEVAGGALRSEDGTRLDVPDAWTPEHVLLGALVRCSLASLAHHAGRSGLAVTEEHGSARALVTKRDEDGRYAVVEATLELSVALEPQPGPDELVELLAKAERDCFIGASLRAKPSYAWTVNGVPV
ncbi:MAG TPA: OsmC family protein [Gaiellaceae bacterium]|nr:OsmC family protein [Gaiellaceae bacterium]